MALSRYDDRFVKINRDPRYRSLFRERRINFVKQYTTPQMNTIGEEPVSGISEIDVVWTNNTKFWRLAEKYYGDSGLWWIIAWYNLSPTEFHVEPGELISIPMPLYRVTAILRNIE